MSPSPVSNASFARTLADLTTPGLIIPQLRGQEVADVIQELSQAMHREKRAPDLLPFYHAALNREFLVSTDTEAGMACPHARLPGLQELFLALGRSAVPLGWGTKAARAVRLVFLIAVPPTDSTQYLLLLSGLTRLARDNRLMEQLHAAPDALQMLEVLRQVRLRANPFAEVQRAGETLANQPWPPPLT